MEIELRTSEDVELLQEGVIESDIAEVKVCIPGSRRPLMRLVFDDDNAPHIIVNIHSLYHLIPSKKTEMNVTDETVMALHRDVRMSQLADALTSKEMYREEALVANRVLKSLGIKMAPHQTRRFQIYTTPPGEERGPMGWYGVHVSEIVTGQRFRMFETDGEPVRDDKGRTDSIAQSDAYLQASEKGHVWTVESKACDEDLP